MIAADLAIVGAGPAGLAAAGEAAALGLSVVVVDDNPRAGGQYFRQPPRQFRRDGSASLDREAARAAPLLAALDHPAVTYLPDAVVWDMPAPLALAVAAGQRSQRVEARAVLVAAGAHDRPVPFPGWTRPGVVSAGGAQNLLKGNRMIAGLRIVVAGNGPLLFVVAASLARAGAEVVALVEAAPLNARLWRAWPGLLAAPKLLRQAIDYRWTLLRAGTPIRAAMTVTAVQGEERVSAATIAPIAADGTIDHGRAETIACDTVVTGFGLMPSVELLRLLGCALTYDRVRGGWLPQRGSGFETSVAGVFAAGDGAAIGGVEIAMLEGRLVAHEVAAKLGRSGGDPARSAALRRRLGRFDRFRRAIEAIFAPPRDYLGLLTDDTVVCRCEDVTAGELRARRDDGLTSMIQLKSTTRTGMGRCQGRNCMATLAAMVAADTGSRIADLVYPRTRPPARPVPIGDLLHENIPPPDLPADPHLPRAPAA